MFSLRAEIAADNMDDAEKILFASMRMLKNPSYAKNFTIGELLDLYAMKDKVLEWRESNPREEYDTEPLRIRREAYDVLGVSPEASEEQIKAAYRRLARRHHPDRNGNSKDSTAKFIELQEAYEDALKRARKL